MKKKINLTAILFAAAILGACNGQNQSSGSLAESSHKTESSATENTTAVSSVKTGEERARLDIADGEYTVDFDTDSSMFKVNESKDGKGILTVKDGEGTVHISLTSKNIVNLYLGTADAAKNDEGGWLLPTTDTVTYSDGLSEEVYGFDVPVPAIDEEFDLALIGKKGIWYDHKVSVENPVPLESDNMVDLTDGTYTCEVTLKGGSGRATIESPATIIVNDGVISADIIWSSPNYEYMIVDEVQYDPIQTEGNSTFQIPIALDKDMEISALTHAMSQLHLINYTLHFDSSTLERQ